MAPLGICFNKHLSASSSRQMVHSKSLRAPLLAPNVNFADYPSAAGVDKHFYRASAASECRVYVENSNCDNCAGRDC